LDIIEQSEECLRLRVRGRASTVICTLDRASGMAEVVRLALGIPYRRKRVALSSITSVAVRRRTRGKIYRAVLEVRFGDAIAIGDTGKDEALGSAQAIRDFLRLAK
jgi:hypothetical protein